MAHDLVIRRALVSVSDKSGLERLVRTLHDRGVEIVSTGGTARFIGALKAHKRHIPVTMVRDVTGFPEIMGGRVKTLHPKIHGGLLGRRDVPEDAAAMRDQAIAPIDLLVVNLYPFERTVADPDVSLADAIENIDIGGPAMIRAAAKNHEHVAVVTDPARYDALLAEMERTDGTISLATRRRLAAEAFARTAAYDAAITNYMAGRAEFAEQRDDDAPEHPLPERIALPLVKVRDLRYGENPHQRAGLYRAAGPEPESIAYGALATARQLHGKPLSYNNLLDANAALGLARDLHALDPSRHGAVVVKHTNPCGAATARTARDAVDGAIAGDPLAAYGGILATTSDVDAPSAARLCEKGTFLEVIIARDFEDEAMEMLTRRSKSVRLLRAAPAVAPDPSDPLDAMAVRSIDGGYLVQERDRAETDAEGWSLAAGDAADPAALRAAAVVWTICKHLSSNAIAVGGIDPEREGCVRLFGAGAGQMDRVASCRIAAAKAGEHARGAIAASDAFFPFPDGPQALIDAGVTMIVQPGGSKRDAETLELCASRGVRCSLTGRRHFRH